VGLVYIVRVDSSIFQPMIFLQFPVVELSSNKFTGLDKLKKVDELSLFSVVQ
jgi:hypothetical protein